MTAAATAACVRHGVQVGMDIRGGRLGDCDGCDGGGAEGEQGDGDSEQDEDGGREW